MYPGGMIAAVGKRGRYEKKIHGMDNVDHDDRHYDANNGKVTV